MFWRDHHLYCGTSFERVMKQCVWILKFRKIKKLPIKTSALIVDRLIYTSQEGKLRKIDSECHQEEVENIRGHRKASLSLKGTVCQKGQTGI